MMPQIPALLMDSAPWPFRLSPDSSWAAGGAQRNSGWAGTQRAVNGLVPCWSISVPVFGMHANAFQIRIDISQNRQSLADSGPHLAEVRPTPAELEPTSLDLATNSANFGESRPKLDVIRPEPINCGRTRANFGGSRPICCQFRRKSTKVDLGQMRQAFGQHRQQHRQLGPKSTTFGQPDAGLLRLRIGPFFCPESANLVSNSTSLGRTSSKSDQNCPASPKIGSKPATEFWQILATLESPPVNTADPTLESWPILAHAGANYIENPQLWTMLWSTWSEMLLTSSNFG